MNGASGRQPGQARPASRRHRRGFPGPARAHGRIPKLTDLVIHDATVLTTMIKCQIMLDVAIVAGPSNSRGDPVTPHLFRARVNLKSCCAEGTEKPEGPVQAYSDVMPGACQSGARIEAGKDSAVLGESLLHRPQIILC